MHAHYSVVRLASARFMAHTALPAAPVDDERIFPSHIPLRTSLVYIFSQVILQRAPFPPMHSGCSYISFRWGLTLTRLLFQISSDARQLYWFRLFGVDSFMWLLLEGTASSLVRRTMRETRYLPLPVGLRADERRQRRWRH